MNPEIEPTQNAHPNPVLIIATYNNAGTIAAVIDGAKEHCSQIIVVNDGSTDATAEILGNRNDIILLSFDSNRGKGCALRAGFEKACAMGFSHAITFDGDGQHMAQDIPRIKEKISQEPDTLWIGNRVVPAAGSEPPLRCRFGRTFGNFWYRFFTGIILHDTQCGFRAYPLYKIGEIKISGKRYEFEQDALIKAAWNGIHVKEFDIHINYQPDKLRVSHFRPVRDFLRISMINSKAGFLRVAFPVATFDAPGKTLGAKIRFIVRYELRAHSTPKRAAASVALGVFLGIFPIHGFQVATLMGLAVLLRLNRVLAFLGVCVSSPPFMPVLIIAAVFVGRLVVPQSIIAQSDPSTFQKVMQGGIEFIIGSVILSVVTGISVYFILYPVFYNLRKAGLLPRRNGRR